MARPPRISPRAIALMASLVIGSKPDATRPRDSLTQPHVNMRLGLESEAYGLLMGNSNPHALWGARPVGRVLTSPFTDVEGGDPPHEGGDSTILPGDE